MLLRVSLIIEAVVRRVVIPQVALRRTPVVEMASGMHALEIPRVSLPRDVYSSRLHRDDVRADVVTAR